MGQLTGQVTPSQARSANTVWRVTRGRKRGLVEAEPAQLPLPVPLQVLLAWLKYGALTGQGLFAAAGQQASRRQCRGGGHGGAQRGAPQKGTARVEVGRGHGTLNTRLLVRQWSLFTKDARESDTL